MSQTNCDPRALKVAQALHEREQPQATILFGSRARGDYDDRRSDIDIMQVNPYEPDPAYKNRAAEWVEAVAQGIYGRPVPVQLVWFAQDEFREHSRYVNHVTTQAMLDGVVMSPHPENYRSRYADDLDESEYEYMWEDYENRLDHAEQHLRVFQTLDDLGESDLMIAQRAHSALEHAMKAVIAALGAAYPSTHNLAHLIGTLRRLPGSGLHDFALSIPPDVYSAYAGHQEYLAGRVAPTLTQQPDYRERTVADAQHLINRARAIRQSHD